MDLGSSVTLKDIQCPDWLQQELMTKFGPEIGTLHILILMMEEYVQKRIKERGGDLPLVKKTRFVK